MNKTLILIRHAHRDKDKGTNGGLSAKGRQQAENIARYFQLHYKERRPMILSSPKARCLETVSTVSQSAGVETAIVPALDEQNESSALFMERLNGFVQWWRTEAPDFVMACSHGDALPFIIKTMVETRVELETGGLVEIYWDKEASQCVLRKVLQIVSTN